MGFVSLLDNLYSFILLGLFNPVRVVCVRVFGKEGLIGLAWGIRDFLLQALWNKKTWSYLSGWF